MHTLLFPSECGLFFLAPDHPSPTSLNVLSFPPSIRPRPVVFAYGALFLPFTGPPPPLMGVGTPNPVLFFGPPPGKPGEFSDGMVLVATLSFFFFPERYSPLGRQLPPSPLEGSEIHPFGLFQGLGSLPFFGGIPPYPGRLGHPLWTSMPPLFSSALPITPNTPHYHGSGPPVHEGFSPLTGVTNFFPTFKNLCFRHPFNLPFRRSLSDRRTPLPTLPPSGAVSYSRHNQRTPPHPVLVTTFMCFSGVTNPAPQYRFLPSPIKRSLCRIPDRRLSFLLLPRAAFFGHGPVSLFPPIFFPPSPHAVVPFFARPSLAPLRTS